MDRVDFWALQRSIQERFVASTESAAAPAPLAIRPLAHDTRQIGWLLLGVAGLLGALVSLRLGFGELVGARLDGDHQEKRFVLVTHGAGTS